MFTTEALVKIAERLGNWGDFIQTHKEGWIEFDSVVFDNRDELADAIEELMNK